MTCRDDIVRTGSQRKQRSLIAEILEEQVQRWPAGEGQEVKGIIRRRERCRRRNGYPCSNRQYRRRIQRGMMRIQRLIAGCAMHETGVGIGLVHIVHSAIRCGLSGKSHGRMRIRQHACLRRQRILHKQNRAQHQAGNQMKQFMIEEMHTARL